MLSTARLDAPRLGPSPAALLAAVALWAAVAGAFVAAPLTAQDEPEEDGGLIIEELDVNLVNVEVFVTDRKGDRITGLTKDDFELLVDKKPVQISNFFAVTGGSVQAELPEMMERPGVEPEAPTPNREVAPLPDDQRLYLIVYVDNFNLRPFNRNRVIRAARGFLRSRLRPGDEVMLVSYDRSLHIRHPFTKDPELVASALYELEDMTGHRIHADNERQDLMDMIYNDARDLYDVRGRVTQYAESIFNDMSFTLDALRDQVETLSGLPGRKAVLYVSDGLSMRAGEDAFHALNDKFTDSSVLLDSHRYDMSRRFQSLIAQANASRVTFYTVDAGGLRTYSYMDASNQNANGGAQIDQIHFSNMQSPLLFLADETGGFAIINTNNFSPGLDKMADDFGTYYSLGFHSGTTEQGRYHKIKVRLKDKDKSIRIRHREGFRDKPVGTRMAESALAALHFGYQKNPLGVSLDAGKPTRQDRKHYLVPFVVRIPIGNLTFLPREGIQQGRVRLFIAAKDNEGGLAEVQEVPVPIEIPDKDFERARNQDYHYQLTLLMREGRQVVAVGVRDEVGSTIGFATRSVTLSN